MPYKISEDGLSVHKLNSDGSLGRILPAGSHKTHVNALANLHSVEIGLANEKSYAIPIDATVDGDSSMVALYPPEEISAYIGTLVKNALASYEDSDHFQLVDPVDYHVTLLYLGTGIAQEYLNGVTKVLDMRKLFSGPYYGSIQGGGYFNNNGQYATYLSVDSTELSYFRDSVYEDLNKTELYFYQQHGFFPHITVAYSDFPLLSPDIGRVQLFFNGVTLATGNRKTVYEFGNKSSEVETVHSLLLEKSAQYDQQGNLVVEVIGVPFTGPIGGKADLVGDWFDEKSTIRLASKVIESDFDHGHDDLWLPNDLKNKGFGSSSFGVAEMQDGIYKDEESGVEGRLFRVIVDRRNKYITILKKLIDQGVLDASMKMRYRRDGKQKGYIEEAIIEKMSLTPTPMNPNAVSLYKSFLLEVLGDGDLMAVKVKEEPKKEGGGETLADATENTQNGSEKSLGEEINEIFETPVEEGEGEKSVFGLLQNISTRLEKLEAAQAAVANSELEKSLSQLTEDIQEVREAFPILAKQVIAEIRGEQRKRTEKSTVELESEKKAAVVVAKVGNRIPDSAPGKTK